MQIQKSRPHDLKKQPVQERRQLLGVRVCFSDIDDIDIEIIYLQVLTFDCARLYRGMVA